MPTTSVLHQGNGWCRSTHRSARSTDISAAVLRKGTSMPSCQPKARILVVDDDLVTRQLAEEALTQAGFEVESIAEGRRAIEWLEVNCVAVVITDIFMPDVDGLEIVRQVRQQCPEAHVVAMSGGSRMLSQDYLPIAHRLGATVTLTKPFRPSELLAVVRDLIGRVNLTDAVA